MDVEVNRFIEIIDRAQFIKTQSFSKIPTLIDLSS